VRKLIVLIALCTLAFVGGNAAIAFGDNPHPPGCKGDPHKCQPVVTSTTSTSASTTTNTPASPDAQSVTQTIIVAAPPAPASSQSQTVTVVVQPSKVATIVKVKIKKVRRYCTMQRHGWRCIGHPPRSRKR
jgi:hypothetical protein